MSEKLVEQVARAMRNSAEVCSSGPMLATAQFTDYEWDWIAQAAIAIVVERCAEVARERFNFETSGMPDHVFDLQCLAQRNGGRIIASAILALSNQGSEL